jgi:exodeoxyribonuclease-3
MRLVAWNIRGGGGSRWLALAEALRAQQADIIVLGEHTPTGSAPLIAALMREGFGHVLTPVPPARLGAVALLARAPFDPLPASPELPAWRYSPIRSGDVEVHAAYAPNLERDGGHNRYWRAVRARLAQDIARPVLFVGDLNTGETGKDAPPTRRFACSDHFCAVRDLGYVDLWRRQHGDDAREWTYQGRVNPFRIDHAFASPSFVNRVTQCIYRHDEREAQLSDHSMLIVEWA